MQVYEDKNMTIKVVHEGSAQPFLVIKADKCIVNKSIIKLYKNNLGQDEEIGYVTQYYDFIIEYEKSRKV